MKLFFFLAFFFIPLAVDSQSILDSAGEIYGYYINSVNQGDFIEAHIYLDSLLTLKDSLPAYNVALIYNNLGVVSWNLGRYNKAQYYYDIAARTSGRSKPKDRYLQILIRNNQGILYKQLGDYSKAIAYYEMAKNMMISGSLDFNQLYYDQLSMVLFNEALVFLKQENYSKAISLLHESRHIVEKYGFTHLGSVYFNLARSYKLIHNCPEAESFFAKSISQWSNEYDSTYFRLAAVYLEYAQFLAEEGEDSKSQEYFQKSIENYLSNYGPHHPYTASCYNIISDVHFSKGEYIQALNYAQMALGSICPGFESVDFMSNPIGFESLLEMRLLKIYTSKTAALMALANSNQSDYNVGQKELLEFALETTEEGVTVLTRIQDLYRSQESRLFLAEDQKNVFIQGIEVALLLSDLTGEQTYQEKAYKFSSFGKALELKFEMRQKEQLYLSSLQDSSAIRLLKINENIESYSYLIQSEQNKSSPDSTKIAEWKQNRFDFRRQFELVHDSIFGGEPIDGNISNHFTDFSLSQIKSKLKRKQTLVEFSISGVEDDDSRKLFAFVIDRKKVFIYKTILDSTFSVSSRNILDKLHGFDPFRSNVSDRRQLDSALTTMNGLVFDPLKSKIKGTWVTIVPDEELSLIPFEAFIQTKLMDENTSGYQSYLIRDYEFSYLPSSSLLRAPKHRWKLKPLDLKILSQDFMDQSGSAYSNLTAVEAETESILDLIKGTKVTTNQPKQDILKVIEHADIVHFAVHNIPSDKAQSSSYMVLSTEADSAMNHLLFDYEIDPLSLNASMVVLNACESGSGQLHPGEGVLSMTRSFMLAGAESAISAQWPVDDRVGSSIITDFYRRLAKGDTKSGALRKSQLNYLEHSTPSFSHPYYWAGYQLVGDPSKIRSNRIIRIPTIITLLLLIGVSGWRLSKKKRSEI